jgi:hypothetical protein
VILLEEYAPSLDNNWGGALFLASIGLSFWAVYMNNRQHWWAILPGGTLLTLALIAASSTTLAATTVGACFFGGLALTFVVLALQPGESGHTQRWALYPGGGLGLLAITTLTSSTELFAILWPIALIIAGLFLVIRPFYSAGRHH